MKEVVFFCGPKGEKMFTSSREGDNRQDKDIALQRKEHSTVQE